MSRRKKILFIITGLVGGGAEKALVNLLSVLDKNRYEIDLLIIFADKVGINQLQDVDIYTLFPSAQSILYKFAKHLYLDLHIKWLLNYVTRRKIQDRYDTIVSFLEGDSLLYHSCLFNSGDVNISWVHTDFVENHWSQCHFVGADEYSAYKSLDKLVFVSEYAKKQFSKVYPLPLEIDQYVCANVINAEEIVTKSTEYIDIVKTKFTICSVGRLEEVKGYDMVIEAAKLLKERGVSVDFWIIGKGSQENQLKAHLKQAQCEDMVHFLGYKSNPYPYMRAADVYLSSSYAEGLPLVLYEAQCLAKPIIATDTIGAREILCGGIDGCLVDINTLSIANAIEYFVIGEESLTHFKVAAQLKISKCVEHTLILQKISEIIN